MKQLALIGSTASGKSDLALTLAQRCNGVLLSIDSLSIYRHIDIVSAKPSKQELASAIHFGIDRLDPDSNASVMTFIDEYERAHKHCLAENKNLIIVGGSSFYLKSMLDGLSKIPEFSPATVQKTKELLTDLPAVHRVLSEIDPHSMAKIAPFDAYRIEKMLLIHIETGMAPSAWFEANPPRPIITECPVLDLKIDRALLRSRIALRTEKMVQMGLIDEVAELERLYGRTPNSMKSIGIVETLQYLDGKITQEEMISTISTHTSQLAKRQQTFNTNQFALTATGSSDQLLSIAMKLLD